jgi:DNA helicase-2/ATP-dependent DNA helicase PcrA
LQNEEQGLETGIDRTRRLLYVTCSRAQASLAIVDYTENPANTKAHALLAGWFQEDEIIGLDQI